MNKIVSISLISITLLLMFSFSNQQAKDLSLGRVQKMSGKLVFINAEPINNYDVAFEIKEGMVLGNFSTPDEIGNLVVSKALKQSKKENKDFDGVIIGSSKVDIAIKFK